MRPSVSPRTQALEQGVVNFGRIVVLGAQLLDISSLFAAANCPRNVYWFPSPALDASWAASLRFSAVSALHQYNSSRSVLSTSGRTLNPPHHKQDGWLVARNLR